MSSELLVLSLQDNPELNDSSLDGDDLVKLRVRQECTLWGLIVPKAWESSSIGTMMLLRWATAILKFQSLSVWK